MLAQFKQIDADPLLLDKRPLFTNPAELSVQIHNQVNMEEPHFLLNVSGVFSYNYAYVPLWGKYYFLGEPTYLDGNRLTVSAVCDVLTTNADEIKALSINLARTSGNQHNKRMRDGLQPSQVNRQCQTIEAKDSYIYTANPDDIRYVLTVQGGAHRATS